MAEDILTETITDLPAAAALTGNEVAPIDQLDGANLVTRKATTQAIADRSLASVLAGFVSGAGAVSASDTILSAIQKIVGNIGALVTGVSSVNGETGVVVLDKADIGLGSVDNTSDANKPVSTAQQTALDLKANIASPTFTGTVSGITKNMVGLSNVDNTSDANKPISTATQTALNAKYDVTNPANYVDASGAISATFAPATVTASRALTQSDNRKLISNVGAGAEVNLTAPSGLQSPSFAASIANLDGDGIKFTVPGGCFIYFGDQLSSDGGYISTTSIGSVLNVCQISASIWVVTSATGTWIMG